MTIDPITSLPTSGESSYLVSLNLHTHFLTPFYPLNGGTNSLDWGLRAGQAVPFTLSAFPSHGRRTITTHLSAR